MVCTSSRQAGSTCSVSSSSCPASLPGSCSCVLPNKVRILAWALIPGYPISALGVRCSADATSALWVLLFLLFLHSPFLLLTDHSFLTLSPTAINILYRTLLGSHGCDFSLYDEDSRIPYSKLCIMQGSGQIWICKSNAIYMTLTKCLMLLQVPCEGDLAESWELTYKACPCLIRGNEKTQIKKLSLNHTVNKRQSWDFKFRHSGGL